MKNAFGKLLLAFVLVVICGKTSFTQTVNIIFNAAVYGQTVEGLSFAQLTNSLSADLNTTLTIRVRENSGLDVLTVHVPLFLLHRGGGLIDRSAFNRSTFSFAENYLGKMLRMGGRFPEGEYEFCFELDLSASKDQVDIPFVERCFVQAIMPLTPLMLLNPVDEDIECNARPTFLWQPPMPVPVGALFRLVLVELAPSQEVIEAISLNVPLINQLNIPGNQLIYPANAKSLTVGRTYAWQVILYVGTVIVKRSEIWIYTVQCDEPPQMSPQESFRELKQGVDGDYYLSTGMLKFSLNNPYSEHPLLYSITEIADPSKVVRRLPTLTCRPGLNKYAIDLEENNQMRSGAEYLLRVTVANGQILKLRFKFQPE